MNADGVLLECCPAGLISELRKNDASPCSARACGVPRAGFEPATNGLERPTLPNFVSRYQMRSSAFIFRSDNDLYRLWFC